MVGRPDLPLSSDAGAHWSLLTVSRGTGEAPWRALHWDSCMGSHTRCAAKAVQRLRSHECWSATPDAEVFPVPQQPYGTNMCGECVAAFALQALCSWS
eukprot:1558466-Karenia_brevis.AAC.1